MQDSVAAMSGVRPASKQGPNAVRRDAAVRLEHITHRFGSFTALD